MDDFDNIIIDENMFSAWLDGTLSPEEDEIFINVCAESPKMGEILDANDQIDEYYENIVDEGYELPEEFTDNFELPYIASFDDGIDVYVDDSDDDEYISGDDDVVENDKFLDCDENDDSGSDAQDYQDIGII